MIENEKTEIEKFVEGLIADESVRNFESQEFSVYDFLKGEGFKNPSLTLKRICAQYPEYTPVSAVLTECYDCENPKIRLRQFPGERQRLTPVATITVLWELGSLLPTIRGGKYREIGADSAIKRGTNDKRLTQELLSRHNDRTAAELMSERVEAMTDLGSAQIVRESADQKIAKLLLEAGIPFGDDVPEPAFSESAYNRAFKPRYAKENWQLVAGVKWFCVPGTNTWQVDVETPNYNDYCLWRQWYPKADLPLKDAIEALNLIKSGQ